MLISQFVITSNAYISCDPKGRVRFIHLSYPMFVLYSVTHAQIKYLFIVNKCSADKPNRKTTRAFPSYVFFQSMTERLDWFSDCR